MQPYDVVMLVVLAGATAWGAMRGMIWQVASLASIVVSSFVAVHYSHLLPIKASADDSTNSVIAMLTIYLATSFAIWIVFRLVANLIARVRLKEFDRQLGFMLGAAKGCLWCILITFFVVTMSPWGRQQVLASRSGHYISQVIHRGGPLLPKQVHESIGQYLDQLERELDPKYEPPKTEKKPDPTDAGQTRAHSS